MRTAVAVAAAAVALAGCSGGSASDAEPSASPTTTDITLPSEIDERVDKSALYDERFLERPNVLAPGHGLRMVASIDERLGDGDRWLPLTGTPDGKLVVSIYDRHDGAVRTTALLDPRTGDFTTLAQDQPGSPASADADGRWIVWVTTTAKDPFTYPWELWSYDRRTGRVRKVAEAPDVGVHPVPAAPDGTAPELHDGMVYLGAVEEVPKRGQPEPAVYRVPANGAEPLRKLIDHAYAPHVTRDRLYYTVGKGGTFRTWDARRRDLLSGADESIRSVENGPSTAGDYSSAGMLGWQERDEGRCIHYLAEQSDDIERLLSARCGRYTQEYGFATERYLAFSFNRFLGGVTYLYDLEHERLARLGDYFVRASAVGYGSLLAWEPEAGPHRNQVMIGRLTDDAPLQPGDPGYARWR